MENTVANNPSNLNCGDCFIRVFLWESIIVNANKLMDIILINRKFLKDHCKKSEYFGECLPNLQKYSNFPSRYSHGECFIRVFLTINFVVNWYYICQKA